MPNNVSARIKSELNRRWWVLGALFVGLLFWTLVARPQTEYRTLTRNGQTVRLEVAATQDQRSRGLGGRSALPLNQGMLFIYSDEAVRCFWMKDMRFPIDIMWLDGTQKIVHIARNVRPETYPQTFCAAGQPARYVIELPAGQAAPLGADPGQTLRF